MIIAGFFTPLESDIFYYMSFYTIDLVGRLLYRDGSTANCWFTWSGCNGIVNQFEVIEMEESLKGNFDTYLLQNSDSFYDYTDDFASWG